MSNPLISLISINRNNASGLRKTLASVSEQTFRNFQHIVIDGASTDESVEVIREFESGIGFWRSEPDSGIYNAMNKGIAAARGDFLLFLNSGDHFLAPDALQEAAVHLGERDLYYFDIEVREPAAPELVRSRIKRCPDALRFSHFVIDTLPHPSCFIRRSLFERFGGYDEALKICADWKAFMLWVCKFGCSYQHVPQVLSVFYFDGVSSHASSRRAIEAERQQVLRAEFPVFVQDGFDAVEAREALAQVAALKRSRVVRSLQAAGLLWRF